MSKLRKSALATLSWMLAVLAVILLLLLCDTSTRGGDAKECQAQEIPPAQVPSIGPAPGITPTSDFVLYSRNDSPEDTIWIMDDTGDSQLMVGAHPRLSPDGRYIVYKRGDTWSGDVYVRDLETDLDTKIFTTSNIVANYGWTPDGSQIVFDHECSIYVMDRDGSNQQELVGNWPDSGENHCVNDGPSANMVDGRIAWDNVYYGIGVADADGQNPYWITNTVPNDVWPSWSPDGTWIAFIRNDVNYYKIRPDGTGLTQLTYLSPDDGFGPAGPWTVDGEWLVSPATVDGVEGLYAVATDGSGVIVPESIRSGAAADFVGSVGDLGMGQVFIPLVLAD